MQTKRYNSNFRQYYQAHHWIKDIPPLNIYKAGYRIYFQFSKYSKLVSELKLQRLHILSNLGKTEEINQFKGLSKNDSYHRELTLGKAHDVKNMRQKAIEYYTKAQKLAANIEGLDSNLSYLQKPYKKPSPKPLANAYSLSKGCG